MVPAWLAGGVPGGADAVEFLTDEQVGAYGQWIGPPPRAQLERCFLLDHDDLVLVLPGAANGRSTLRLPGAARFGFSPC
jgi:hypothetical protein